VLEQLTEDHSLVEELVREGRLSPAEAEVHPQRAIITRALGIDPNVEVDLYTIDARTGDRLLLCSDGLTTMVSDDDVLRLALLDTDPRVAADRLVDAANEAGGEDNITVLVIDVLEAPPPAPPDPVALAAVPVSRTPVPLAAPDAPVDHLPRRRRPRLRSLGGLLLYVLPVVVIVGLGIGAVNWYARHTYFVAFKGDRVVVFQGVPGGILGWKPTVETTTHLRRADLTPDAIDQIAHSGKGSLDRAQQFVANLQRAVASTTTTSTTTTTAPTTTSRPKSTTTRAP
jgi:protein phosphatase